MVMRVVHFARSDARPSAEPLCGVWGSMDTDWTDVAGGVTCDACRVALSAAGSMAAAAAGDPPSGRRVG
jgi:hypothetical protein